MAMHTMKLTALVLLMFAATGAIRAGATSFDPLPREQEQAAQAIAPGETTFLFHSGTAETHRSFAIGEVLAVFRFRPDGRRRAVGAIRITAFAGEFCIRGQVVEGTILPNDVAELNHVCLLVIQGTLCPR